MSIILPFRRPLDECRGNCQQGRKVCDCRSIVGKIRPDLSPADFIDPHLGRITLTELDNEVAPCPVRTFSGMTTADKRAESERRAARIRGNAEGVFLAIVAAAVFAALMLALRGGAA